MNIGAQLAVSATSRLSKQVTKRKMRNAIRGLDVIYYFEPQCSYY